jgi:hypothetical protein
MISSWDTGWRDQKAAASNRPCDSSSVGLNPESAAADRHEAGAVQRITAVAAGCGLAIGSAGH